MKTFQEFLSNKYELDEAEKKPSHSIKKARDSFEDIMDEPGPQSDLSSVAMHLHPKKHEHLLRMVKHAEETGQKAEETDDEADHDEHLDAMYKLKANL